jgi:acyl-CoA hydrolase
MTNYTYQPAEEAIKLIKSGDRVFLHGSAATPLHIVNTLIKHKSNYENVELVSITLQGVDLNQADLEGHFYINSLFVSSSTREAVNSSRGDYLPVFLSEIPGLFKNGYLPIEVAMIHVSPPDKHGYCSLGTSVDIARTAMNCAKKVIAQVNPQMPRVHGDAFVEFTKFDAAVWVDEQLPQISYANGHNDITNKIGEIVAGMIEDGSTLQMGIGTIPDAVLRNLTNHKHLGIHTEMFSDGVVPLIENGVIDNSRKKIVPGY